MADRETEKPGLLASLASLGRSFLSLGRAFKGEAPIPDTTAAGPPVQDPELPLFLPPPAEHAEAAQLLTQHMPGWNVPHPMQLPVPTYAPAMTAFGIVFIALGAVTVWPLSVVGAAIFVVAIARWIGELLHDGSK